MFVPSPGAYTRTRMLQVEKKMTAAGEALLSAEAEKRAAVAREDYAAATKCKLEASRQRYLLCEREFESERECERERERDR